MSHMDQNKDIITDIITELVSPSVYQYTSILQGATTHGYTTRMEQTQHTTYGDTTLMVQTLCTTYGDTTRMVTQYTTYGDTTRMVQTRGGGRGQREAATLTLID